MVFSGAGFSTAGEADVAEAIDNHQVKINSSTLLASLIAFIALAVICLLSYMTYSEDRVMRKYKKDLQQADAERAANLKRTPSSSRPSRSTPSSGYPSNTIHSDAAMAAVSVSAFDGGSSSGGCGGGGGGFSGGCDG